VLWILADPHGGMGGAPDAGLLSLLDRAVAAKVDLLILGDLFVAWLGPAKFHTPYQAEVLAKIAALRAAGGQVTFVVGNRDYLLGEPIFDVVIEGEAVLDVGGVPTLVLHGDLANPDDRRYRAWNRISRSAPLSYAMRRAPGAWGRQLTAGIEEKLRGTNQAYKSGLLPIPALTEVGRRAAQAGARRALLGHFHHERILDVPDGVPVIVAPGWCDHQRILLAGADGRLEGRGLGDL
jgi:UDP-2,3-diacylglucosamine hydrolase